MDWWVTHLEGLLDKTPNLVALQIQDVFLGHLLPLTRRGVTSKQPADTDVWHRHLRHVRVTHSVRTKLYPGMMGLKEKRSTVTRLVNEFVEDCDKLLALLPRLAMEWRPSRLLENFVIPAQIQDRFEIRKLNDQGDPPLWEETKLFQVPNEE